MPPHMQNARAVETWSGILVEAQANRGGHRRLICKLQSIANLAEDEMRAVQLLPLSLKSVPADTQIVRDGERPRECCLIVEGFVCRFKMLSDGRRQIMSFHIPGDIPDLQSLHLKILDHSIAAVGVPAILAFIQHQDLHDITRQHAGIAAALWRDTLIDAAIFREWMVGLGRRAAIRRFAHLVCEMALRMKAVGLADHQTYDFPVTQSDLGDALGLSTVHVNRVLQEIRKKGLLEFKGSTITIRDWKGLEELGEFDPIYLHQNSAAGMLDG